MRQWVHSRRDTQTCGYCGKVIPRGTPMLEITMHQARTRVRCPECAGEPVPETLPAPGELTAPIDAVGVHEVAMTRIVPNWSWLLDKRPTERPEHFPDLVPVGDAWSPFRDGGE